VHVGANDGRERAAYGALDLPVLWIEALPEAYSRLRRNLAEFPKQRARCALVTDRDGVNYSFGVSSNNGRSSSIYELAQHKDTWPDIHYVKRVELTSTTLERVLDEERVSYNLLVLDAQGAELDILRGAGRHLTQFTHVHLEVADYQAYAGACLLHEVMDWMTARGYAETEREEFGYHPSGAGCYYNIAFSSCAAS